MRQNIQDRQLPALSLTKVASPEMQEVVKDLQALRGSAQIANLDIEPYRSLCASAMWITIAGIAVVTDTSSGERLSYLSAYPHSESL
jgi:hypothetical protein